MKKLEKLNENEVLEIYSLLEFDSVHLDGLNWNYKLMQGILARISENKSCGIDLGGLFKKLFMSSDTEILGVLIDSDIYWGEDDENLYKSPDRISPKEKLLEIAAFESETPLKWNTNEITELEFLMVSQTMKHDFVVSVGESFEENYAIWSANKNNFCKLLDELALSNQSIKVQKLQVAKENIF
ncbi:hypothetical protein ACNQGP_05015 [Flavobacterium sp. GT2N3]|uniref:hypothetical protein n=1 Tax=unclassified Flavobacterium TaxID=196869 RepID=UPI003AAAB634